MNAPIDIVISIIKRHLREEKLDYRLEELSEYGQGKREAYTGLINEFEGLKKLFN